MFCLLESFVFQILTNFSVTKVKSLPGKVRESVKKDLNENLVEWSIIENVVHNLTSKVNVANVWKEHFSVFCWFLSDEFETLFWKSEGKHSKLFQSNFSRKKLLKKWFRSYLELKKEYCEPLERAFYSFLQVSAWRSWNHFQGKWSKTSETI